MEAWSEASGTLVVGESAVTLAAAAEAAHTQQSHLSGGLHRSRSHLVLITLHQAVSPQGRTSEQLQHPLSQVTGKGIFRN